MGIADPVVPVTVVVPPVRGARARLARAALRQPFTRRAARELLFCLLAIPLGLSVAVVAFLASGLAVLVALVDPGLDSTWVAAVAMIPGLLLLILLAPRLARGLAPVHRRLAASLLGERVTAPPPLHPSRRPVGWFGAGLRDGPGWRTVAYTLLKLPMVAFESYAAFLWTAALIDLTYPFWWGLFRNHPPGTELSPVLVLTPFPGRVFHVATFSGTFLALAVGAGMLLAAPWVTRAVVWADRWLIRGLLGPGRLTQRIRDLEQTRALAVDGSAAQLRRVERDLHDGAQARLAALALTLGMASEKLGDEGDAPDVAQARELVEAARRSAKGALAELRDLARGIHPPVLDSGLADALATLAAGSAIPVELSTDVPVRPTPAIETIAYFCAAELLANAAKHSDATRVRIDAAGRQRALVLTVTDDGTGGADPARGSGLAGLAHRVSTVDGRLTIASPPGGPTRVSVELPLRA